MAESAMSIGGAWAGLDSGNDDNLLQQYYSKNLNSNFDRFNRLLSPAKLGTQQAFADYRDAYNANTPEALKNQAFYKNIASGILSDPTTQTSTYNDLRAGNLSSLSDVYRSVLDYGLAGQKAKLAAGGYGNTGPSSYDRILSSTMTASNIAPVLQTIYGNLGRDAASNYGAQRSWDAYRLGQFAQDPLTGYLDTATAGRAINPYLTHLGLINAPLQTLSNLGGMYRGNSAGFSVEKGLTSRLNDFDQGHLNAMNNAASLYSKASGLGGMGGMGGGMGGSMGSAGSAAPYVSQSTPYSAGMSYGGGYPSGGTDFSQYYQNTAQPVPNFGTSGNYPNSIYGQYYNPNSPGLAY